MMRFLAITLLFLIYLDANAQRHGTGLVFNDINYAKAKVRANFNNQDFELLPTSHSLKQFSPTPGNQLQLNTSPSWATAWSARAILDAQVYQWETPEDISLHTYSPSYLYQHIRPIDDESCASGIELYDALEFLKANRLKMFDDFLEFCPRNVPEEFSLKNVGHSIDYRKLFEDSDSPAYKVNAVKKSISQNLPVVIGLHCPPSFFTAKKFWQPAENMSREYPGHAICVVGYNDDIYGGSFEILNSWGKEWGNNGFLWIPYDKFTEFTRYAFEVFQLRTEEFGNQLSGSIQLKLNTDKIIPLEQINKGVYRSADPFKTGTYFRIYLKNENPAYVYVFGVDAANQYDKVFPHQNNISAALIYRSDGLAIPGEDSYIEMVGSPGQENLCIIYSKESIDFDNLLTNLSKYPGSMLENLDALLNDQLITPDKVSWTQNGIVFSATSQNQSAIFIQIQINHI